MHLIFERIVYIDFENNENPDKPIYKKLIVELMGKHSNIILTNENNIIIDSLRHSSVEENAQRDIFPTYRYITPKPSKFDVLSLYDNNIISSNNLTFKPVMDGNVQKDYILTLSNKEENQYNLNYYLDDFYFNKESQENFLNSKNRINNIVSENLKKYQKRLKNIEEKLSNCDNMDMYRIYGELITSNLYKVTNKNIDSITLENYYDNNKLVTIPLDSKYSPSYNAKKYFKKYSKLKNAKEIVGVQKQDTLKEIDYLESVVYEIQNCTSFDEINNIYEELLDVGIIVKKEKKKNSKINNSKKNTKSISFNPLEYIIDDYKIYVGRNNKENDYLTTKFANKNDIWFHTKDIHGSHVILKTHPNETVPYEIIEKAAKLAVTHSKAKNSSNVPVDYCQVMFVKKPNHSNPGYVTYKNNKTIIVKNAI